MAGGAKDAARPRSHETMTASLDPEAQGHSNERVNRDGTCPACGREAVDVQERTDDEGLVYREYWHVPFDWNDDYDFHQEWCEEYPSGMKQTMQEYPDGQRKVA